MNSVLKQNILTSIQKEEKLYKAMELKDDITKWICEWLATHYRKDHRCNFHWRFPDGQWTWQDIDMNISSDDYMAVTAGDSEYAFSIKFKHIYFFTNGKKTL